jgi:hypothetical protein
VAGQMDPRCSVVGDVVGTRQRPSTVDVFRHRESRQPRSGGGFDVVEIELTVPLTQNWPMHRALGRRLAGVAPAAVHVPRVGARPMILPASPTPERAVVA